MIYSMKVIPPGQGAAEPVHDFTAEIEKAYLAAASPRCRKAPAIAREAPIGPRLIAESVLECAAEITGQPLPVE
jgi:hypothetical protein